jgi:O-antigen/teichoic acid export membrane protein
MSSAIPLVKQAKGRLKVPSLLKNLSITFSENVITKGLSFLTILILTRTLGPEEYGKYSFVFVTVAMCSALFDFGMENTAVRFASRDKDQVQPIFGLYLLVKLGTLLSLVLFFAVAGQWLFGVMHKSEVSQYIPYLIAGLIGESLFFVNDTYLQARQRFQFRALLNIARYTVALLYVAFLMSGQWLALQTVLLVYLVPLLFSMVFLGKYVGFVRSFLKEGLKKPLLHELFGYERWMFVYSVAYNLLSRVDFFMLGFWVHFQQLGIYNAAFQLCSIVSFLPMCLGKVLLPALSELPEKEVFVKTKKLIRVTVMICLAATALIPLTHWFVPLLLGKEYVAAVPILQILLLAFIIGLLSMPYEQSLYSLGRPKVLSIGRYVQLLFIVVLNLIFLPMSGLTSGAYVVALTGLVSRVFYLFYARHFYLAYERSVGMLPLRPLATGSM